MEIEKTLIDYIKKNCNSDEFTGNLICKNCKQIVYIDWHEMSIYCSGCDCL